MFCHMRIVPAFEPAEERLSGVVLSLESLELSLKVPGSNRLMDAMSAVERFLTGAG